MTASGTDAHRITVSGPVVAVRIEIDGVVVADSSRARVLREGSLPPRYYLPRADVRTDLLVSTEHTTHCPFKGDASYWTLVVDDARHENIAWSYEEPLPARTEIAGLLCFHDERVALVVDGEPAETQRTQGEP